MCCEAPVLHQAARRRPLHRACSRRALATRGDGGQRRANCRIAANDRCSATLGLGRNLENVGQAPADRVRSGRDPARAGRPAAAPARTPAHLGACPRRRRSSIGGTGEAGVAWTDFQQQQQQQHRCQWRRHAQASRAAATRSHTGCGAGGCGGSSFQAGSRIYAAGTAEQKAAADARAHAGGCARTCAACCRSRAGAAAGPAAAAAGPASTMPD